jgi:hypothetical protein
MAALAVAGYFAPSARADSVATFYQGKDIKLLISGTVGGGYDIYARTLAKHLGAHIRNSTRPSFRGWELRPPKWRYISCGTPRRSERCKTRRLSR